MVLINPGWFLMGSPDGDGEEKEHPQHPVRITRAFFLGASEVTRAQYQAVMGDTPNPLQEPDDAPMNNVSWLEAVIFCNRLSIREKRPPYYSVRGEGDSAEATIIRTDGVGYRLPTEAEWEYACRAGSETRFPFGDDASLLGQYAWFNGNAREQTHPSATRGCRTHGACTICWAMSGSGARTVAMRRIIETRRGTILGLRSRRGSASSAAGASGTTISAARPVVKGTRGRADGATWASAWPPSRTDGGRHLVRPRSGPRSAVILPDRVEDVERHGGPVDGPDRMDSRRPGCARCPWARGGRVTPPTVNSSWPETRNPICS